MALRAASTLTSAARSSTVGFTVNAARERAVRIELVDRPRPTRGQVDLLDGCDSPTRPRSIGAMSLRPAEEGRDDAPVLCQLMSRKRSVSSDCRNLQGRALLQNGEDRGYHRDVHLYFL